MKLRVNSEYMPVDVIFFHYKLIHPDTHQIAQSQIRGKETDCKLCNAAKRE